MILTWQHAAGASLAIGEGRLRLVAAEGLDTPPRRMIIARGPALEGLAAMRSIFEPRRIWIEALLDVSGCSEAEAVELRTQLCRTFAPSEKPGILTVTRAGRRRAIEACPAQPPVVAPRKPHEAWHAVTIDFICPRPFFRNTETTTHAVRYYATCTEFSEEGIEFPAEGLQIAQMAHTGSRSSTILHEGNAPAPLRIRFTGPMTNPYIRNLTTAQTIRIDHEIREGESLEIDTEPGRRQITLWKGHEPQNGMHYLDLSSSFFLLEPGENLIEIGDESPQEGSEALFEFQSHYHEA